MQDYQQLFFLFLFYKKRDKIISNLYTYCVDELVFFLTKSLVMSSVTTLLLQNIVYALTNIHLRMSRI